MDMFVIGLGVFAVILAFQSIKIVPQQNAWVIERFGKYNRSLEPGLSIVIPFMDRVAYRHRLTEFPIDIAPQVCITRDNTQVQVDGVLYYQITDAARASYGTSNYLAAITMLAQTALRSECGKRDLDKLLEDRDAINRTVVFALDEASPNWGVKVLRYEIKDITPPAQVLASMQKQITAEREKRALIAQSEGKKQEEINLAEGKMTASIRESEGTRQAAINNAQGEAEALLLVANATAESIKVVASATQSEGGLVAVNLKVAEKFVEAFGNIAKQGNTMILPGNAADIAAMVATAMQVVKKS
ncbi:MAG: SPFH domain-containing protein [Gallionella sp.]|nr:SPFH domain-containing protein [Gallionella sp.]